MELLHNQRALSSVFLLYSFPCLSLPYWLLPLWRKKNKCYPKSQAKQFYPHSGPEGSDSIQKWTYLDTYSSKGNIYLPMEGIYLLGLTAKKMKSSPESPFLA